MNQLKPIHHNISEPDDETTKIDTSEAVYSLSSAKASENDCIPSEVLKENKENHLPHLYNRFIRCWIEGIIAYGMRHAKIVRLYE